MDIPGKTPRSLIFRRGAVLALALIGTAACAGKRFPAIGPLPPVPIPRDNLQSPAKVELGKLLFFDPRLSGDGSTSCATCHDPKLGWGDGKGISRGYPGTKHWRNSQTIVDSAYYTKLFWAGEKPSLEALNDFAITGNLAGNGDPMLIEERLRQIPEYVTRFKEVFARRPQYPDVLKAIAAFEREVPISRNVPFDDYMRGDRSAMSPEAVAGMKLFNGKAGCIQCHNGPFFSDQDFHAIGVPDNPLFNADPLRQIALRYQHSSRGVSEETYRGAHTDYGLYYTTKREQDKGKFRTPHLRHLKYTAPYSHNGILYTLEELLLFYNNGGGSEGRSIGPDFNPRSSAIATEWRSERPRRNKDPLLKPLNLTDAELEALVSFLEALSGDEIVVDPPKLPAYGKTVLIKGDTR